MDKALGQNWKLANSAWLILSLFGMAWIGFIIIGCKAREKKWIITGIVYAVVINFLFYGIYTVNYIVADTCLLLWALAIIVSIIHSVLANRKYLICREILVTSGSLKRSKAEERAAIRKRYEERGVIKPQREDGKVDINRGFDSVEEFYEAAEIKPHIAAKLDEKLVCEEKKEEGQDGRKGRILDI